MKKIGDGSGSVVDVAACPEVVGVQLIDSPTVESVVTEGVKSGWVGIDYSAVR